MPDVWSDKVIRTRRPRAVNTPGARAPFLCRGYASDGDDYNPQAQTYFDAVATAGGTLDNTFKQAFSDMFDSAQGGANPWYDDVVQMIVYAGGTANAARINAVSPGVLDDTLVNSPTIDAVIGVTWDGFTQYARSGLIPSVHFTQFNWCCFAVAIVANDALATHDIIAASVSSTQRILLQAHNTTTSTSRMVGNGSPTAAGNVMADSDDILGSRTANNNLFFMHNGAVITTTTTVDTGTLVNLEFYHGARNTSGVAGQYSNGKWCMLIEADNITTAKGQQMSQNVRTFLTAIGI